MNRPETIEFKEIPTAAAIMGHTGRIPNVLHNDGADLVTFEFKRDMEIDAIVMALATGKLMVNASQYEKARSYLYRKAREVKR
ncbi:MAG TPA: hypothetical protein HPP76_01855 [Desulfuromonadales bacterium]|nr:hypothetical protein [Desulfuromonadales bacterium]